MNYLARCLAILWIVLASQHAVAPAAEPKYLVETSETRRVEATLKFEVTCPQMQAKEWLIFAASVPELTSQRRVKSTADPAAQTVLDTRVRSRELLVVRVPGDSEARKQKVSAVFRYEATLVKRRLRERTAKDKFGAPPTLGREEQAINLVVTKQSDYKDVGFGKFLDRSGLRRSAGESEIEFAKRVYHYGKAHGTYEYRPDVPRRATEVADSWRTDCGGWANWFVAVMRASGVPARALVGRWAKSQDSRSTPSNQGHVKAEFFAAGVGWAPVDLSQAVQHDRRNESLRYFGVEDGDFITLHVDTDVKLQTRESGPQEWSAAQSPAFWVSGQVTVVGSTMTEYWHVREIRGTAK